MLFTLEHTHTHIRIIQKLVHLNEFDDILNLMLLSVGEAASGKANKSVAKHIPGSLEGLGARASCAANEVNRAHKLMLERGEKLNQLEDRAERMRSEAENFSSSAHDLMLKYRDKKWYQL